MTLLHAEGYEMGLYYGNLAVEPLLGVRWATVLLFYLLECLTLKRNGVAL